jgi:VCBS repeat protein
MRRRTTVLAVAGLAAGGGAVAQPLYTDVTATHLPAGIAGPCMNAAAGDADGDGDLDLALAMEFVPKVLLLNAGQGRFGDASAQLPRTIHDSEDVAFADFDLDGDLDLVFVSEDDRKDELFLNDGTGRFDDVSDRLVADDVSNALVVVDLNGDGAPDVLTGNIGVDRALVNDGTGRLRDETATRWRQGGADSRTQDLEAFDADGDGDLDIAVANEGQDQLYFNASGILVDVTATNLPRENAESREIRAADFDADGDLDLVVANVRFVLSEPERDALLLNDGKGVFTPARDGWQPQGGDRSDFTIQAHDLDGDGDVDIVAPNTLFGPAAGDYRVLLNDGSARFTAALADAVLPAPIAGNGFDVEVADFDADGLEDLFLCNRASLRNDPEGSGGMQRLLLRRAR